eukprot:4224836-Amphidinium_carterae.1
MQGDLATMGTTVAKEAFSLTAAATLRRLSWVGTSAPTPKRMLTVVQEGQIPKHTVLTTIITI